jgi:hypothetical protein
MAMAVHGGNSSRRHGAAMRSPNERVMDEDWDRE